MCCMQLHAIEACVEYKPFLSEKKNMLLCVDQRESWIHALHQYTFFVSTNIKMSVRKVRINHNLLQWHFWLLV